MDSRLDFVLLIPVAVLLLVPASAAQQSAPSTTSSTSSSAQHGRKAVPVAESRLDAGSVSKGVYRNPGFGFTCKLPAGWVLRTEEMNAREEGDAGSTKEGRTTLDRTAEGGCPHTCGRVLLAA